MRGSVHSPVVSDRDERVRLLAKLNRGFARVVPHNQALGLEVVELDDARARFRLPWQEKLVGNPKTEVLHGGVITSMMDACCGAAVFMALDAPMPIATLDLRIDYLRPATPRQEVFASAHCYKVTRNVAFVRSIAYQATEDDPIASAAGTFMLGTSVGKAR
jgi:uncharacterized protein (TIGR00369 family)